MLFSSFAYILIFLPVAVLGAVLLRKTAGPRAAQVWVLAASIVFYARSRPFNLLYLFASILANWALARWMERTPASAKRRVLITAVTLNVLYLCAFKYLGFLAATFAWALPHDTHVPEFPFPLGISFFTITQIMYLVDSYDESVTAGSLLDHASFVAFFPYLISGPLGRPARMRHQFDRFGGADGKRAEMTARGIFLFSMGLFKKTVFANAFGQMANFGWQTKGWPGGEQWLFAIAYAMQIYFDFSGYSDMAIGSALMLGLEIPRNFDRPFSAKSTTEFWQRWHISLTNFITTYLFTPIFKSFRKRTMGTSILATLLAMGIAGIWHGAGWTFLVYGLLQGLYLGLNQIWRKKNLPVIPGILSWLLTFGGTVISFVYFGSATVTEGNQRVAQMFQPRGFFNFKVLLGPFLQINGFSFRFFAPLLLLGCVLSIVGASSEQRGRDFVPSPLNCACAAACVLAAFVLMNSSIAVPFVYFRF